MAPKIKVRGRSTDSGETATKPKPAKRTVKRQSTGRSTPAAPKAAAKPAKPAAPKRGPGRPRKQAETPAPEAGPRRNRTSDIDAKDEAKLIKLVTKAGDRRRQAEEEHKESVNALHAAAQEALEAGVSMAKVADASGISRQWLYKMGTFRPEERGGTQLRANGGNGKTTARSVKRPTPPTPPKRRSASAKPAAKASKPTSKSAPKRRVKMRSA
jgi:DNA-binding phage protein